MNEQTSLGVFEGTTVRMFAGFARWRAYQAALRNDRDLAVEQMSFDAGKSIVSMDLFAGFWRNEATEMDWLGDFLCDPATNEMMAVLQEPEARDVWDEDEMVFTKSQLVTTGTEMADYS
jgi:hypothetical protein